MASGGARSELAFWIGGAAGAPPSGTRAGRRSMLAPWIGGAAAPSSSPPVKGGPRSLLAFWMGGAAGAGFAPPPPDVVGYGGRMRRPWQEQAKAQAEANRAIREDIRSAEDGYRRIAEGLPPVAVIEPAAPPSLATASSAPIVEDEGAIPLLLLSL